MDDVIVGNATPEAEQGLNIGRMISLMGLNTDKGAGHDGEPLLQQRQRDHRHRGGQRCTGKADVMRVAAWSA